MTKHELLAALELYVDWGDPEIGHAKADEALLAFINDKDITAAFEAVPRWYA